jgi:hypothetical protein
MKTKIIKDTHIKGNIELEMYFGLRTEYVRLEK